MQHDRRRLGGRLRRAAGAVALTLVAGACSPLGDQTRPSAPEPQPERPLPDLNAVTSALETMRALPEGDPARQAELFESTKDAAAAAPTAANRLKLALALATPGHGASDFVAARRQLSELLATPETLLPVERLLAEVQLHDVDQRLILQAENKQLRDEARQGADHQQTTGGRIG